MIRIALSVCDALYYAYNEPDVDGLPRKVIHRDISPSNILVGYDGQVKLADFGIAKVLAHDGGTQATTIKGKYGYLTPEQIRSAPLDQRSDLFSLGTMLWEMSVGKRLFQRDSEMQMMYAILEEPIPPPSAHVPGYPADLERVVMKALARNRDDRYPDANALADDLRRVARDHGWDCEKPALSQLVKRTLPEDQPAFGPLGSSPFSPSSGVRRRKSATGNWDDGPDSFAQLVVIDPEISRPPPPRTPWLTKETVVTTSIMLAASAVFWIWVVPILVP
jgi:serine/threonine protein kinase